MTRQKQRIMEEIPHIVKEFSIGNTRIKIADNYCRDKTPEQVQAILREIARTAQENITAAAYRNQSAG